MTERVEHSLEGTSIAGSHRSESEQQPTTTASASYCVSAAYSVTS